MGQSSENFLQVAHAVLTDVGMRRANNQDSVLVETAQSAERWTRYGHLFVVADGMGAHAAGELASRLAADKIAFHYLKASERTATESLRQAVRSANAEIYRRGQENPEFHNMGTTASALVLGPWGAIAAHVGDSRIYRVRKGLLEQLTFDHSLVWEMEASGQVQRGSMISEAIPKNVITRSLGPGPDVMVDVEGPFPVEPGDVFLLCSDGLTGQVDDVELGVLMSLLPPDEAVQVLVDLANLRGGPDNITVVVARVKNGDSEQSSLLPAKATSSENVLPWLITAAVGLVATLIVFATLGGSAAMFVAVGLIIAIAIVRFLLLPSTKPPPLHDQAMPNISGNQQSGPYRQYDCEANDDFVSRLGGTVAALRKAAEEKQWRIDWTPIDDLQAEAAKFRRAGKYPDAIRRHARAIIRTMKELREQHSKESSDSVLEY